MDLSASNPQHTMRPPRLNGRYVVTRLLGKGAQARVYLAFDARLKQWRAVKVLAANYIDDDHVRQRFEHEAEAMARLSHRNLLRVVDIDTDGGTPFIVMELARGGAVTDWLKRNGAMPPALAIDVITQACEGLAHAHSVGVVHRDVKPHNLLIADDGRVLLTDFGIAQLAESESMTQTGSVMGTFAYMAPEQRNDAKSVDGRADVYALGASLYTILTMKTSAELFFAEARDEILEPVPLPLRDVVLRACRYDRDERLASVLALRDLLRERLPQVPELMGPPLTDAIKPLPEMPPNLLEPNSGVEDLQKAMALRDADAPTYVPRGRLEELLEGQSTTLYSDTGIDEAPAPPYVMPDMERSPARRPLEELSEEDVPSYIDVSTMDRAPKAPEPLVIAPPTPQPVAPAPLHTVEPPHQRKPLAPVVPPPQPVNRAPVMALGGVIAFMLLTMALFVGYGVAEKVTASLQHASAGAALVRVTVDQQSVISVLSSAGADQRPLEDAWFALQDALPKDKPAKAAVFVQLVEQEAERLQLTDIGAMQASTLSSARRDWERTETALHEARASFAAQLTGDLGL